MTRSEALTRRADKLMEWLRRQEYFVYAGDDSIEKLVRLIDLIIYAFEQSMPKEQWRVFLEQFRAAREQVNDVFETEYTTKLNYDEVVAGLLIILEQYKRHVAAGK